MKVYVNRSPVSGPWGGGNLFIKAFHEFSSRKGIELLAGSQTINMVPDVMLLVGLENQSPAEISVEQAIMYKAYMKPDCKLVLRVNENDARKGTNHMDSMLLKMSEHIDATVFVSKWLQDYFNEKGWACKNQTVIYNGVDRGIFQCQPKLDNGKLNIVAHHWSDNRMKGADIYEKLDEFVGVNSDKFTFTYIGRHQCNFKHTQVIQPLSGKSLGKELGKYDLYVSASRWDPGPNHVLEALACDMPTWVHKDGGGAVEFAGYAHAYGDWEQLKDILESPPYHGNVQSRTLLTWQTCVDEYNAFLEATWKANT